MPHAHLPPTLIAPETFLVHDHHHHHDHHHDHYWERFTPGVVANNSLIIRGPNPIVVDTGIAVSRQQFLHDVSAIVDPADLRWVFISHDDIDHTGNLAALMELAPGATAVLTWLMVQRLGPTWPIPATRMRWVGDGESFDIGDRRLYAVRPPVYDSPTTRGLFDPTTGVYWAADCFATSLTEPVPTVGDLDTRQWARGMVAGGRAHSPWVSLVEEHRYQASVDRIAALGATTFAGAHTPVIGRAHTAAALSALRGLPTAAVPPEPDQSTLDDALNST
ncbi:MAG: MBL fold metallo-hydrolase [Acidimicrobiales bacterium]